MNILEFFTTINFYLDIPVTYSFLAIGIFFTIKLGIPQLRALPRFISFARDGFKRKESSKVESINAFHALFAALATSFGIGTIVGPSLAIVLGGPGALFWMVVYAFFGSVTKLVEVVYALKFRKITEDGKIIGGPAEYLKQVLPFFAHWYSFATIFLFAGWSGIQSKAFSEILLQQGVPEWLSGAGLALLVFAILIGGAKRVGNFASKLVPFMFVMYVSFALYILCMHLSTLSSVFYLIVHSIFSPAASVGGFLGATIFAAIRQGTYKAVYITESGMGTAAIPHSMSDVKHPIDQGVLAMYSVAADTFLCVLSGLLVLVTGVWTTGQLSNSLIFNVFQNELPFFGPLIFIICIALFILTTTVGNSFNGGQNFASITNYRGINWYYALVCGVIFVSSVSDLSLVWAVADSIIPLVALPNLLGLLWLSFKYPRDLKIR